MTEPALAIDNLSVRVNGRPVLEGVSLIAQAGEITAVLGESGSGKTMTLLAAMGLLPPGAKATGAVRLNGRNILGLRETQLQSVRGAHMGLVFQEPMTALNPVRTIGAQVGETVRLHAPRTPLALVREKARTALDHAGLSGIGLDRYPHELSGGQRQRVAIAIASALSPRILFADEPTTALDVLTQAEILKLFSARAHEEGAAIVLVTHDVALAARIADRVIVMKAGRVLDEGSTREVLRSPRHHETRALVEAATRMPVRTPPAPDAPLALDVRNVIVRYQTGRSLIGQGRSFDALKGVSLHVRRGEIVGLVGESGSGKSTLARAIVGLEPLAGGMIALGGEAFAGADREGVRRARRKAQIVFQDPVSSFDPRWRVGRIIAEPLHVLAERPDAAEADRRVRDLLVQVGLKEEHALHLPHQFSGGQRQRIGLARALITAPDLIVLDEAVSALDAATRADMLDLLAELSGRLGLGYLFITHDLALVRRLADRVVVLQGGQIVEEGETEAVLGAPRHAYTAALAEASLALVS